jgi:hypothetical protein
MKYSPSKAAAGADAAIQNDVTIESFRPPLARSVKESHKYLQPGVQIPMLMGGAE